MMNEQKRKRVVIACDPCRRTRRKCDGVEPTCETCRKRGRACNYSYEIDKRKPPSRDHVAALTRKIEFLENKVAAFERKFDVLNSNAIENANESGSSNTIVPKFNDQIDPFGKLNIGEDGQLRCYGPRSCLSFISRKLDILSPIRLMDHRMEAMQATVLLGKYYEISEDLRDHLLDLFWTFQNSSLCLVCKDLFLREMNSGNSGKFYSLALLSAMLAVGARYSDRPEVRMNSNDPGSAGVKYADLAKLLLSYEREYPSLPTVQASAIIAIFYIYIDMEAAAWDASGSAIRTAFALGISLSYESWVENGDISEDEEKARRIVWWGCYILDKVISNILGRPIAIKRYNITSLVPTEECIDEYSKWEDPVRPDHPLNGVQSRLFSTATFMIELYMISSEPLDQIHLAFHPSPKSEIESIVNNANLELIEFERALPNFMRLARARKEPQLPHVYIFHLRYHHIQILLHRVLCLRDDQQPQGLEDEDLHQRLCRINANAITKIIQDYRANYGLGSLDFAAPDCFCTAAIVHLYLSETADLRIKTTAMKNFAICVDALKDTSERNLWSHRNLAALRILAEEWSLDYLFTNLW